jgi:hypothetical protein
MAQGCKRILIRMLCLVISFAASSLAHAQQRMSDPLFGILYDPHKVHFESVPSDVLQKCPRLRGRYVAAWVYAHLKTADSEYFLIAGLVKFYNDDANHIVSGIAPEGDGGLVVALRGSQCLVDQEDYFFTQKPNPARHATPIVAPTPVPTGLLQDAFNKYVAAFGGKQEFSKFSKRTKPEAIGPPIIRQQLALFENGSAINH